MAPMPPMSFNIAHPAYSFFSHSYLYFLWVNFSLMIFLFLKKRKIFFEEFRRVNAFHITLVLIALLAASVIRFHYFLDKIPVNFFAEQFSVANSFYYHKQAFICNCGTFASCESSIAPIHPNGFAFLVYLFFLVFGNSFFAYTLCSALFSSLTVIAIYLLAVLLFDDSVAGVLAGFIFAFLAEHIRITDARAVVAGSIVFILIFMITALTAVKKKNDPMLYLLALLTLFFTANMRFENIILVFVFFIAYHLYRPHAVKYPKVIMYCALAMLVSLPLFLMHMFSSDALTSAIGKNAVLGGRIDKLFLNAAAYYKYWTSRPFYQPLYLAALIGFVVLLWDKRYRTISRIMLSWISIYCLVYLFHKNIGYDRYAMHLFPQYVLLVSLGISWVIGFICRLLTKDSNPLSRGALSNILLSGVVIVICLGLNGFINFSRSREAASLYSPILNGISSDAYVILDDTSAMVFLKYKCVIFNYGGYNKRLLRSRFEQGNDIYFLTRDGMCKRYKDQGYVPNCENIFTDFPFVEVKKSGRYTLYKVYREPGKAEVK